MTLQIYTIFSCTRHLSQVEKECGAQCIVDWKGVDAYFQCAHLSY